MPWGSSARDKEWEEGTGGNVSEPERGIYCQRAKEAGSTWPSEALLPSRFSFHTCTPDTASDRRSPQRTKSALVLAEVPGELLPACEGHSLFRSYLSMKINASFRLYCLRKCSSSACPQVFAPRPPCQCHVPSACHHHAPLKNLPHASVLPVTLTRGNSEKQPSCPITLPGHCRVQGEGRVPGSTNSVVSFNPTQVCPSFDPRTRHWPWTRVLPLLYKGP